LTLREAAGLAGRSFSFWGQVERGEQAVTNFRTLEAMAVAGMRCGHAGLRHR
jgi:hypothetical protein